MLRGENKSERERRRVQRPFSPSSQLCLLPALTAYVCFAWKRESWRQNSRKSVWRMHQSGDANCWNKHPPTLVARHRQELRPSGVRLCSLYTSGLGSFRLQPCQPLGPPGDTLDPLSRAEQRRKRKCLKHYSEGCSGQAWKRQQLVGFTFYWPNLSHMTPRNRKGGWEIREIRTSCVVSGTAEGRLASEPRFCPRELHPRPGSLVIASVIPGYPRPLEDMRHVDSLQPRELFTFAEEKTVLISGVVWSTQGNHEGGTDL